MMNTVVPADSMTDPTATRCKLDRLLADHRSAKLNVQREKQALREAEAAANHALEAQRLVQAVAEKVQSEAHAQIATVVTHCLRSVFRDSSYAFEIDFHRARGKTEARFRLVRGGVVIEDPLNEAGGGVIDVAAFALRVACLTLAVPRRRKLLVIDEPFRFVSKEYRSAVRELVEALARETGIQFLIVTHSSEYEIGKVIRIGETNDDDSSDR